MAEPPTQRLIVEPIEDYRLHQMHHYTLRPLNNAGNDYIRKNYDKILSTIAPEFHFIGEINVVGYDHNRFYIFEAHNGTRFTITDLPYIWNKDVLVSSHSLLTRLRRIHSIVERKNTNAELDDYFRRISKNEKFFSQNSISEKNNVKIEKYDLGEIPGTAMRKVYVKRVIETENTITEVYDTEMKHEGDWTKSRHHAGKSVQRDVIQTVHGFIFPLYKTRRGWSDSFLEKLHAKSFETVNDTRYIIVRRKNLDGTPGEILSCIGLNRAPYGKVRYFDSKLANWVEEWGPIGYAYKTLKNYASQGWPESQSHWGQKIPILGMEQYLGNKPFLNRPSVIESVQLPDFSLTYRLYPIGGDIKRLLRNVDPEKPVYFSSGVIYEPIRFGVVESNQLRGLAYSEILTEMFKAVFSGERSPDFNMNGQYLYTYNDRKGVVLYRRMGFEQTSDSKIVADGTEWHVLGLSPEKLLGKISNDQFLREKVSTEFVESFSENLNRMLEGQNQDKH